MAQIKLKNSVTSGSIPAGLSFGEVAVNITDKKLFVGNAVESTVTIYDPNNHVLSFNGSTGAVTFNNYVASINGATGAITNVARTNEGNTFSVRQVMNAGITSAGLYVTSGSTFDSTIAATSTTNTIDSIASTDGIGLRVARAIGGGPSSIGGILLGRSSTSEYNYLLYTATGTFYVINGTGAAAPQLMTLNSVDANFNVPIRGATFSSTAGRITVQKNAYVGSDSGTVRIVGVDALSSQYNSDIRANADAAADTTHTLPAVTGTLLNTASSYVTGVNGITGPVGITAGSNITITLSGKTLTIASTASGGTGGSGAGFTYASSAPSTPAIGDRWIDSDTGREYVYINDGTSSQWIEPTSSNGLEGLTYYAATKFYEFGGTGSFVKLGVGTTAPASTLDVAGTAAITSTTNSLDIIATTDGAGLRIAQATSGGNSRIGAIRLGRGAASSTNTYLENSVGTFAIYNGVGNTGTKMFQLTNAEASFSVPVVGPTFASAPASDGGYRITSNAINALTGTTYSLLAADNGKVITWNNASGVTLTVPSGLPVGFNTTIIQIGTGSVGITGSGVTLNSFEGKLRIVGQHAAVSIISYSSNVFNVAGGLTG